MADLTLIAAFSPDYKQAQLEDGRIVDVTAFYASGTRVPLKTTDEIRTEHRVETFEEAEVIRLDIPTRDLEVASILVDVSGITFDNGKPN